MLGCFMRTPHEIAEKFAVIAAKKLFGADWEYDVLSGAISDLTPIIEAAIEEAYEAGWHIGVADKLESRLAQESKP